MTIILLISLVIAVISILLVITAEAIMSLKNPSAEGMELYKKEEETRKNPIKSIAIDKESVLATKSTTWERAAEGPFTANSRPPARAYYSALGNYLASFNEPSLPLLDEVTISPLSLDTLVSLDLDNYLVKLSNFPWENDSFAAAEKSVISSCSPPRKHSLEKDLPPPPTPFERANTLPSLPALPTVTSRKNFAHLKKPLPKLS